MKGYIGSGTLSSRRKNGMAAQRLGMKISLQALSIISSSIAAFAILAAAVLWITQYDQYRNIATIVAFLDIVPFVAALTWIVISYRRSPTPFAKDVISILSVAAFAVMPTAFWWLSLFDSQDKRRTLPIVIAAVDTVPFVLGLMWFAFRFPVYPDAFGRSFINRHGAAYLFLAFIVLGVLLRLSFGR